MSFTALHLFFALPLCFGTEFEVLGRLKVNEGAEVSTSSTASPLIFVSSTTHPGNVGIGTANPTEKLTISGGSILLDNSQGLKFGGGPALFFSNGTSAYIRSPSSSGGFRFQNSAGSVDRIVFTDGGSVGIGTTSPTAPLSFGGSAAQIAMATSDASDSAVLQIGGGGDVGSGRGAYANFHGNEHASAGLVQFFAGNASGGSIDFYTNLGGGDVAKMRIQRDGNVGIGTTNPTAKLHVVDGDIKISTTGTSRGIIFQDGTQQVTAASGSTLAVSSSVVTSDYTTFSTTLGTAVTGSSVSFACSGANPVEVKVSASIGQDGSGSVTRLALYMDGAPIDAVFSSTVGCAEAREPGASSVATFPAFCHAIRSCSAGTHNFYFSASRATAAGTVTVHCGTSPCVMSVSQIQ